MNILQFAIYICFLIQMSHDREPDTTKLNPIFISYLSPGPCRAFKAIPELFYIVYYLTSSYSNASLLQQNKKMKHDSHNRIMTFTKIFNKTKKSVLTFFTMQQAHIRTFKSYIKSFLTLTVFHFYYTHGTYVGTFHVYSLKTKIFLLSMADRSPM